MNRFIPYSNILFKIIASFMSLFLSLSIYGQQNPSKRSWSDVKARTHEQFESFSPSVIQNKFPGLIDIKKVPNSEGRYYLWHNKNADSFIYDTQTRKVYPTMYNNEYRQYDSLIYIGIRKNEPIFYDYNYDLFGLNGFYAEIDAEETSINCSKIQNNEICLSDLNGDDVWIPLKKIPHANRLIFDLDYYKDNIVYNLSPNSDESVSDNYISLFVCIPKLKSLRKIKKHILYWIEDCYAASKGESYICDVSKVSSEKDLVENIKNYFIQHETHPFIQSKNDSVFIEGHNEEYKVYLLYSNEKYASFWAEYYVGSDLKCSYAATFDIERNRRLTLSDMITDEGIIKINDILKKTYGSLGIEDFMMPVLLAEEGLMFFMGEREPSFEAVNSMLISVMYPNLDYLNGMYSPLIPYSYIDQYLKIQIGKDGKTVNDDLLYYFEPIDNESINKDNKKVPVPLRSRSIVSRTAKMIKFEGKTNEGYNRNYAKIIQEVIPQKAIDIYTKLSEEYHTTIAAPIIRNNDFYTHILNAYYHYNNNQYNIVDSLCKELFRVMPIDTLKVLTTNYAPYLLTNKILGEKLDTYSDSITIYDYSTEEGINSYIDNMILLAKTKHKLNDIKGERNYIHRTVDLLLPYLQDKMPFLSKDLEKKLWNHYRDWLLCDLLKAAIRLQEPIIMKDAYDAQLMGKGFLLNTEVAMIKHIMNSEDSKTKNDLLEYLRLKEEVEKCRRLGQLKLMNELQKQIEDFYESLMRSVSFSNYMKSQNISLLSVIQNLKPGEIAIEFAEIKEDEGNTYYALLVQSNDSVPSIIRICTEKDLEKSTIDDIQNGNLYKLIWSPIEKIMDSCNTIFFSPSALLHAYAIESAVNSKTKHRMSERYNMYRLSSTREIVLERDSLFKKNTKKKSFGLLIGGLDFNNSIRHTTEGGKMENNNLSIIRGSAHLQSVKPLPSSLREIDDITPFFHVIENIDSIVSLYGKNGTESSFRSYSKQSLRLLHIATHGFYLSDKSYNKLNKRNYIAKLGMNYKDIEEKGLIRSGLLFAGANQALKKKKSFSEEDDGIMTAMEISTMDLHDVDLTVLSACQTASGVIGDDGVFGLQRGFKKAGVKSIIMSLWPVDDDATCLFMKKFYEHLSKNYDKQKALNAAQHYLQDNSKYKAPHFWAPFILLDGIQ